MFLFKRKKKISANPAQERIAGKIVLTCLRIQNRWALFMQNKFERFSRAGKKYAVVCFSLLAGGYSLYLVADNLTNKKKYFSVTRINVSSHFLRTGEPKNSPSIPETELKKIERFRNYMDSLMQTSSGKKAHDSILRSRPGLMDSVIEIEKIYKLKKY